MADNLALSYNQRQVPVATIDVLPDDVLLTIFDFHVVPYQDLDFLVLDDFDTKSKIGWWQSLVHVCRRWRGLVFGSPRRLDLRLCYDPETSAKKTLNVWPALPLIINGSVYEGLLNNVISEVEHSHRICHINLYFSKTTTSHVDKLWAAMQVPFPELIFLFLSFEAYSGSRVPGLPDSFLGGSAPRLRFLSLDSISFPGLPDLLLSVTHLVQLRLWDIPHSGYISPEAMATCISGLTRLEDFVFQFESPQSSPDEGSRRSPPPTRTVLPALTKFSFKGANEYLEELVARIDTPRLCNLSATFFYDVDFNIPELIRLVSHSSIFKAPNEAHVCFRSRIALVRLQPQAPNAEYFLLDILCREPNQQLESVAEICTTFLPHLSTTENLFIYEPEYSHPYWKDGIENVEWLELLLPFTAVKNLYVSKQFAPRVAPALQEMTDGGTTEVLSALQNLYLEGFQPSESVEEGIEQFISARRLTNRPVAVSLWGRNTVAGQVGGGR